MLVTLGLRQTIREMVRLLIRLGKAVGTWDSVSPVGTWQASPIVGIIHTTFHMSCLKSEAGAAAQRVSRCSLAGSGAPNIRLGTRRVKRALVQVKMAIIDDISFCMLRVIGDP